MARCPKKHTEGIVEVVRDTTAVHVDDGLKFDPAHAKAETTGDEDGYSGASRTQRNPDGCSQSV